jgi:hypothetical protein
MDMRKRVDNISVPVARLSPVEQEISKKENKNY